MSINDTVENKYWRVQLKRVARVQKQHCNNDGFKTFIATLTDWYISTFSTTSTLRLPVYILSVVDAYQKAYGTEKNVMLMLIQSVLMYCRKFKWSCWRSEVKWRVMKLFLNYNDWSYGSEKDRWTRELWIGMRDRTMRGKMKVLIIVDNIFNYNIWYNYYYYYMT